MKDVKYYLEMEVQELFHEILSLESGDLWDGISSKHNAEECKLATLAFGLKMIELGAKWA